MTRLTERTLIPLSLIVTLAPAVYWLTTIYSTGAANAAAIMDVKEQRKEDSRILRQINERLSRIEGKLGIRISGP